MATQTTNLKLPRPVATDTFNLASYNAFVDAIDTNVKTELDKKETPTASQAKADAALTTAKAYADTKKTEAITAANSYADTKKTEAITASQTYVGAVSGLVTSVKTTHVDAINELAGKYNIYKNTQGSNGIYTVVEYKRKNGTLYMRSTLSNLVSNNYTTQVVQYFDAAGTTAVLTETYTLTYDAAGNVISEVMQ